MKGEIAQLSNSPYNQRVSAPPDPSLNISAPCRFTRSYLFFHLPFAKSNYVLPSYLFNAQSGFDDLSSHFDIP